jgi:uncharacterized RDD family membrane protein YckC
MIYFYRIIAFFIDLLISLFLYFVIIMIYNSLFQNPDSALALFLIISTITGPLILHTTIIALNHGQSLGKMIFGLKIVDAKSCEVPPVWKIALREIIKLTNLNTIIGFITLIVILQKPQNNQTVTDWGIGCRVIFKNMPKQKLAVPQVA